MAQVRAGALVRDLALAVGWAVFVGVGIALGLVLGSLGADVPADAGMLTLVGFFAGVGTLVVRLAMVAWKHRGAPRPGDGAPRREPSEPSGPAAERPARPARPRPVAVGKPATARKPAPAGRKQAPRSARAPKKKPPGSPPGAPRGTM